MKRMLPMHQRGKHFVIHEGLSISALVSVV